MRVFASAGDANHAIVYLARADSGEIVEFVEAVQPPVPRQKKWVIIVSSLFGCPVRCPICDAGGYYHGKLSAEEILAQIDYVIDRRFPDRIVPVEKFKIQFARVGEPAFNPAVLDVLEQMPTRYRAPGLMPTISTIAPTGSEDFFERLMEIKNSLYSGGNFQFQFSIHTTDAQLRDKLIPIKKWDFAQIARYSERFYKPGDRKITLNFALAKDSPIDPHIMLDNFDPRIFILKITPINPTFSAMAGGFSTYIDPYSAANRHDVIEKLREAGFEVILSIGNVEENFIGSNCGQFIEKYLRENAELEGGYTYKIRELPEAEIMPSSAVNPQI